MSIDETTCRESKEGRCLTCDHFIPKEQFATVEETSQILRKSQATIRKYIKQGKLKAEKYSYSERYGRKTFKHEFWAIYRSSMKEA